ncbi:hypothetical protein GCM10011607_12830 [Shewanella inventionis]|uniref:Uncharacterized protein n=1 Tax=Shewanella inventionis TaxID=1738770 RepID=A0ABQ1IVR5_9GAMM|nr:hypothetical protein [Shewanella inventionis]GGB53683.1 hypothetical protein GCM10011607_12830 [Shewanella inventionis]
MDSVDFAIALRRYRILDYLDKHIHKGWTDKNITPLLRNMPAGLKLDNSVNWRTICRWRQRLLDSNGNIAALSPSKGTGRKTTRTVGDEALLLPTIKRMLVTAPPLKVSVYHREYAEEVDSYNGLVLEDTQRISKLSYKSFKSRYEKMKIDYEKKMERARSFTPKNRLDLKEFNN